MKKLLKRAAAFVLAISLAGTVPVSADTLPPRAVLMPEEETLQEGAGLNVSAPSALLMEPQTGSVIYEKNADERRSPASITKIMTLLLIFEELEKGSLKLEDMVTTS